MDEDGNVMRSRYMMSNFSSALLNATLAISQMFVADLPLRLAAVKAVENEEDVVEDGGGSLNVEGSFKTEEIWDQEDYNSRASSALRAHTSRRNITTVRWGTKSSI